MMEKSEPTLAPQWLKAGGNVTRGRGTASSLSSVHHSVTSPSRNKLQVHHKDHVLGKSSGLDNTSSSVFRGSYSPNSSSQLRSYSSFGSNQSRRNWDKNNYEIRDKVILGRESDTPGNNIHNNFESDRLRRSLSMITEKSGEKWLKRSSSTNKSNHSVGINLLSKDSPTGSMHRASSKMDFPSLGVDERQMVSDVGRVPSPGPGTAIQSLPKRTSALIGSDKWTSALVEVPVKAGSNGSGNSSVPYVDPSSLVLRTSTGLSSAETVTKGPRAQSSQQLFMGAQKLEELAIKQSKQLIPLTPPMPKALALSSSDKLKSKVGVQRHPSSMTYSSGPSHHGDEGLVRSEVMKNSSVGKLQVLKPAREANVVSAAVKDGSDPTTNVQAENACSVIAGPVTAKNKANKPSSGYKPIMKTRILTSQVQSRNDFFNLVRQKSKANSSSVTDPGCANLEKPSEVEAATEAEAFQVGDIPIADEPNPDHPSQSIEEAVCNSDACVEQEAHDGNGHTNSVTFLCSEEEETAFLRSLGWEEDADEGGLTEEEINAFYRDVAKYINSKLSLRVLQGIESRFILPINSQVGDVGGVSS